MALAVGVGVALAAPEPAAPPPQGTHVVRYRDDKLSVDLHDVSVATTMADVARESGAELIGTPREDRRLTLVFQDIPAKEALERLVGAGRTHAPSTTTGKLKAIELRAARRHATSPRPDGTAVDEKTAAKQYAFFKASDSHRPGSR